jgi:F-type H+-transporting ATPase subunit epsilon
MATFKLEIVTPEKMIFSGEVSSLLAWGVEGQLGILPHHAPLMTMLQPGDLVIKKGGEEDTLTLSGGFLEVRPDKVVVLADACERAEEIDVARAEEAKKHAQEALKTAPDASFWTFSASSLTFSAT